MSDSNGSPRMHVRDRYILEVETYRDPTQGKGTWNQMKCGVIEVHADGSRTRIGEFIRNYSELYSTWEPFEQNGKAYALCAPNYTGTSVMALPECEIVAEEGKWNAFGFCPTGFFVPDQVKSSADDNSPEPLPEKWRGKFGFVCGCVWGDDQSWKVQFLDLSNIADGKIARDDRFGYLELPGTASSLRDSVLVKDTDDDWMTIGITHETRWVGGLKLTAIARDDEEELDINEIADRVRNEILKTVGTALKDEKVVAKLSDETVRDSVRRSVYRALMMFPRGG